MGTIFDIKRFAIHDGPGIRITVFLKGCPLQCSWCHNPESISREIQCVSRNYRVGESVFAENETVGYNITVVELLAEILKEKVFMEESGGGVTFSGGEPLMQPDFLLESLKACVDAGLHTVVDTSGFASQKVLEQIAPYTRLFLYDIKLMDDQLHRSYTGVSNSIILRNFEWLVNQNCQVRVRIPVVPGATATHDNLSQIADYLKGLNFPFCKVDLLPFHHAAGHKYERFRLSNEFAGISSVSMAEMEEIRKMYFS